MITKEKLSWIIVNDFIEKYERQPNPEDVIQSSLLAQSMLTLGMLDSPQHEHLKEYAKGRGGIIYAGQCNSQEEEEKNVATFSLLDVFNLLDAYDHLKKLIKTCMDTDLDNTDLDYIHDNIEFLKELKEKYLDKAGNQKQ